MKDNNNQKLNKVPSFTSMRNEITQNNYDINIFENLNNSNFNEYFSNDKFETELKTTINEVKYINNNNANNIYNITNFNFSIINNKKNNKHKTTKGIKKRIKSNDKKNNKRLGRKSKRDLNNQNNISYNSDSHNKFSDDNMRQKCKNFILRQLFEFINSKIKYIYKENKGIGNERKELKILSKGDKRKYTLSYDKDFLNKKLSDIFSQNISSRCNNFSLDHNKKIIEALINEENNEKREYFQELFNLTFIDCLKHFRGELYYTELEGLRYLENVKDEIIKEHGEKYLEHFNYYITNYEKIIEKKCQNK